MTERITLSDLLEELIGMILDYLPLRDLLAVTCVCRELKYAAYINYNKRNRLRASRILHKTVSSDMILNYRLVRNTLFYEYGWLHGLWKINSTVYGGLIHVAFNGYELVGVRYSAPSQLRQPLRSERLFTVSVVGGACVTACHRPACDVAGVSRHACLISRSNESDSELQITCERADDSLILAYSDVTWKQWLAVQLDTKSVDEALQNCPWIDLYREKFSILHKEVSIVCSRLHIPAYREGAVIQPGLFKGTYSAHGIELVLLTYSDDMNSATITKISGDNNVPTGKVTVEADLLSVVSSDNESGNTVSNNTADSSNGCNATNRAMQRYNVPENYYVRDCCVPSHCITRYRSRGQVALDGYMNAEFIDGEWVVFDDNRFGHDWKDLTSFSLYVRVEENFPVLIDPNPPPFSS